MFTHKLPALPFIYRTFIGMVLLTAASSFLTPAAFAASQSTTPPPLIETVCKDTSIRQGWVIVDILTDWHRCKGGLLNPGNVWAITKATGPTNVCSNSPIPQGFVVTAQGIDVQNCRLGGRRTITPVAGLSAITTCPADAAAATSSAATGTDLNALVQKTLHPVSGKAMLVCADSPLPKGYWVKLHTIFLTSCPLDQQGT